MIENFEEKNKDIIFKVGEVSYNFGSYKIIKDKEEEDSTYGETILKILNDELAAIKTKLQELSSQLDSEEMMLYGLERTVTFD